MKKIIATFFLISTSIYADANYGYVKVSDQWILFPGLAVGYHIHDKHHGLNIDLTAYSYWDAGYSLYGKWHYLYYPTQKHFYWGMGVGVIGGQFSAGMRCGAIPITFYDGFFIKPTLEGVIGYEWNTEKTPFFLQFELGGTYGDIPLYPALSFGIGF